MTSIFHFRCKWCPDLKECHSFYEEHGCKNESRVIYPGMCPTKITRNVVNDEHDYYVMLTDMDDQTKFSANWIDYSAPVDTSDIYVKVQ